MKRKGIVVNETDVLLYGQMLTGRKYIPKANGGVELEKQWAKQILPFAYQTVVKVRVFIYIKRVHRKVKALLLPSAIPTIPSASPDFFLKIILFRTSRPSTRLWPASVASTSSFLQQPPSSWWECRTTVLWERCVFSWSAALLVKEYWLSDVRCCACTIGIL